MMTRKPPSHQRLYEIASQQGGYFTAEQARRAGFTSKLIWYHARRGRFARLHRGLYRLHQYPSSPEDHILEAWLAAGPAAVVSHESALSVHRLSNVVPARVHLTVPRTHRWVGRRLPQGVTLHTTTRPLRPVDVVIRGPLRVTSAVRSIFDAAESGTAPEQIVLAVRQALEQGLTTRRELLSVVDQRSQRVADLIHRGMRRCPWREVPRRRDVSAGSAGQAPHPFWERRHSL